MLNGVLQAATSTSLDLTQLLPAIGGFSGGAAFGALLGYGFKKLLKFLLIIASVIAAFVAGVLGLGEYMGFWTITIHYDRIISFLSGAVSSALSLATSLMQTISVGLPVVGGLSVGFAFGFKKG